MEVNLYMNNGMLHKPGIWKVLDFEPYNDSGQPVILPVKSDLIKSASAELAPEILAFINNNNVPDGFVRTIIAALGAYDAYGPNKNGDAFYESDLLHVDSEHNVPMFKTYEIFGKPYKHHRNTESDKSYGRVLLAVYNPVMKRVELIADISRDDAPDTCGMIDAGKLPKTSMGFRAKYDVCEICKNKAASRAQYCAHARHQMLSILPDGRIVCVRNPEGHFFDISFVNKPAEPISLVMRKVAQHAPAMVVLSADRALEEGYGDLLDTTQGKEADIDKEIETKIELVDLPEDHREFIDYGVPALKAAEQRLPQQLIDKFASSTFKETLATMALFGIAPHPDEFQEIVLRQAGHAKLANEFKERDIVFRPLTQVGEPVYPESKYINHGLAQKIAHEYRSVLENRSYHRPYLLKRALTLSDFGQGIFEKDVNINLPFPKQEQAPLPTVHNYNMYSAQKPSDPVLNGLYETNPMAALLALGGLFGAVRYITRQADTGFDRYLRRNPAMILPVLGGSAALTWLGQNAVKNRFVKESGIGREVVDAIDNSMLLRTALSVPAVYSIAQYGKEQVRAGEEPNIFVESVSKNPGLYLLIPALAGKNLLQNIGAGAKKLVSKFASAIETDMLLAGEYAPEIADEYIISTATNFGRKNYKKNSIS